jgi:hypothetical protein
MAKGGLSFASCRHSMVGVVELNGPNHVGGWFGFGSLAGAADTDGFAQIVLADNHNKPLRSGAGSRAAAILAACDRDRPALFRLGEV